MESHAQPEALEIQKTIRRKRSIRVRVSSFVPIVVDLVKLLLLADSRDLSGFPILRPSNGACMRASGDAVFMIWAWRSYGDACSVAPLHGHGWLTTRESTPVRGPYWILWSCTSVLFLVVTRFALSSVLFFALFLRWWIGTFSNPITSCSFLVWVQTEWGCGWLTEEK